jgi:sRNA-binding protein
MTMTYTRTTYKKATATIAALAARWPAAFHVYEPRRRPLKIGISHDIVAAVAGEIDKKDISYALRLYTCGWHYLRAIKNGAPRINLDGQQDGVCTKDEERGAAERLRPMKERQKQKYKMEQRAKTKAKRLDSRVAAKIAPATPSPAPGKAADASKPVGTAKVLLEVMPANGAGKPLGLADLRAAARARRQGLTPPTESVTLR